MTIFSYLLFFILNMCLCVQEGLFYFLISVYGFYVAWLHIKTLSLHYNSFIMIVCL